MLCDHQGKFHGQTEFTQKSIQTLQFIDVTKEVCETIYTKLYRSPLYIIFKYKK